MADKLLTEGDWKSFARNRKLKDDALIKALQACEKAEQGPAAGLLEALDRLRKEAQALRKASKGDEAVDKQLGKLLDALERQHQASSKAAAEEAEGEEATPALLSTKLKPLIREIKAGEISYPALVCTAGAETAVLIERRSIGASRRKLLMAAVYASGGARFWPAQCTFENNALTFIFDTVPAKMAKRIHAALLKQTELRLKVRARGQDGSSEEDGEDAAEPPATASDAPPAVATDDSAPTAAAPSPDEQAYRQQLKGLLPAVQQALRNAHPQLQKIRAVLGFASEKADAAGDFAAARKALDMVARLLAEVASVAGPSAQPAQAPEPASAFNAHLAALLPSIKSAPRAVAAWAAEAGALAKARRYGEAEALLQRIEAALAAGSPGPSLAPLDKARLAWVATRQHAQRELQRLGRVLAAEYQDDPEEQVALAAAQQRLQALVAGFDTGLEDRLTQLLQAEAQARGPLLEQSRALLAQLQELVDGDAVLAELDGNEYTPDMQVAGPLRQVLRDIAQALP